MVPFATPLTFLTDNRQEVIRCLAISELKLAASSTRDDAMMPLRSTLSVRLVFMYYYFHYHSK